MPIPKRALPGPELLPGLALFYNAFWDLTTERHDYDAPIPWSKILLWATRHRLDTEATASLEHHIRAMDLAFLDWKRQNKGRGKSTEKPEEPRNGDVRSVRGKHAAARRQG